MIIEHPLQFIHSCLDLQMRNTTNLEFSNNIRCIIQGIATRQNI